MSPLRWTTKSTRKLAAELAAQGHRVGADTVGDLLRAEGFSLQGNAKTIEGRQHPDRDAQFRYISEQVKAHQGSGDPVISVDTKKKELVGEFKNAGREWRPKGQPVATRTHDFPEDSLGKARSRNLGCPRCRHGHRHHPVGQGRSAGLQRAASPADPPRPHPSRPYPGHGHALNSLAPETEKAE